MTPIQNATPDGWVGANGFWPKPPEAIEAPGAMAEPGELALVELPREAVPTPAPNTPTPVLNMFLGFQKTCQHRARGHELAGDDLHRRRSVGDGSPGSLNLH